MPITPALRKLRQDGHKFKTSLGYIARPCLKRNKEEKRKKKKAN
jgi:hypothetical protein